jgi:hypothetical protein
MLRSNTIRRNKQAPASGFFERIFLEQKLGNTVGYILFTLIAIVFGYLTATQTLAGIGLFAAVVGLFVVMICMLSTEAGLYINMAFAFFASFANRLLFNDDFQIGIVSDILISANFLSLFIGKTDYRKNFRELSQSIIFITILLYALFLVVQLFNPYARSFDGWFQTFRRFITCIFLLSIAYSVFTNFQVIKRYLKALFVMAVLAALYGCYQQWNGNPAFELELIYSKRGNETLFVNGGIRKFSTMSGPQAFGAVMAACAIIFLILSTFIKSMKYKIILAAGSIFMLLGMTYSGTRTASIMIVAGMVMFIMLTFNKKNTRIFAFVGTLIFIFLLKAPIYSNPSLNRFRSSFEGSKDASYNVREQNRKTIQPYIYSHPIGGGLCTTGEPGIRFNPGHELAGFPPDGSYLRKALETGWIGLIFIMILYYITIRYGLRGYFSTRSEKRKIIYAITLAVFLAFYVAEFPQEALGQISDMVVYYPLMAMIIRFRNWDKEEATPQNESADILPTETTSS